MSFLTGSANCIKYTLFAFNLAFVITGIILISVGIGVAATFGEYDAFLSEKFFSIPTLLIVTGAFIFVIAFFGCFGAIKENYWMILIFSVLLGIIFVLELAAGISGYVLQKKAEDLINSQLQIQMKEYPKDNPVTELWDFMQTKFTCCGVVKYSDWDNVLSNTLTVNGTTVPGLPLSCCNIPSGTIGEFQCPSLNGNKNMNPNGCLTEFTNYISAHAVSLGAAGVVIAVIQFFGVFFACYIAREIKIRDGVSGFM